jgi:hypothetical protein
VALRLEVSLLVTGAHTAKVANKGLIATLLIAACAFK